MSYEVTITFEENYLHVIVTGNSTYENAAGLWKTVAAECKKHNCYNILGEQMLNNGMPTMDAWNHQTIFSEAGITAKFLIAWVDHNPKTFANTDFIRTVLSNRDIGYGKVFSDAAKAKSWLLTKITNRR
jgi:hypothetical protein